MSVSIHYREDVSDRRGAERALEAQPPRAFVTWRVGDSDADFVLSYNSETFKRTEHVPLLRGSDGSFRATQSRDEGSFRTLTDFVCTRRYIDAEAAVRTDTRLPQPVAPAHVASGAGVTTEPPVETSGLRRRAPVGGRAELPTDLPLPLPRRAKARGSDGAGDGDDDDAVVPPTCQHGTQNIVFAIAGCLGALLAASAVLEYREHERAYESAATHVMPRHRRALPLPRVPPAPPSPLALQSASPRTPPS